MTATGSIRILHVDDNQEFAALAAERLTREDDGFTVETVSSASEGLEYLADHDVDCIVSDYEMPQQNGIDFLETVNKQSPDVPFILFTGKGSEEIASTAISAGVTDYLQKTSKTEQFEILANRIRNAVDRMRAQRDRRRHHNAIETAKEGIGILNEDGEFRYVNEAYADLYGYDPEEMIGRHWEVIYRDEDVQQAFDEILPQVEENGHWSGETTGLRADGTTFIEDHTLASTKDGGLVCTVRNVSDRKEREQELETAQNRYEMLFENNPIVIWEHDFSESKAYVDELAAETDDLGGYFDANPNAVVELFDRVRTIDVNQNAVEYYNADSKDHLLNNVEKVLDEEAWELTKRLWQSVAAGETQFRGETVAVTFDGERRHQMLDLYVPEAHDEDFERVYMTGTDITPLKRREQELTRERDRLDEFANVLSHDLRNPLNVATSRLELATEEYDSDHLADVNRALNRIATLVDNLRTLAREGDPVTNLEPVAYADLIEGCWKTVQTEQASLTIDVDGVIQADRSRLKQLFENLIHNAVKHGGTDVTVTVGELEDGFYVADDGPGIANDERDKVFDHGYSTAGIGTGFGLAIVEEIAEAHNWETRVTESDDDGAQFEFTGVEFVEW
jgi:PAS domain S-box-containing protein